MPSAVLRLTVWPRAEETIGAFFMMYHPTTWCSFYWRSRVELPPPRRGMRHNALQFTGVSIGWLFLGFMETLIAA